MRLIVLTALALLFGAPRVQAQDPGAAHPTVPLPPAVERVLRDYESAWRARDAQRLAALFHEDGFVLSQGRPPVRGRPAIAQHYAGSGGELRLRAIGYAGSDTIAWVVGMFSGSAGPEVGKFVLALRRATPEAPWLIAADMDNPNQRQE